VSCHIFKKKKKKKKNQKRKQENQKRKKGELGATRFGLGWVEPPSWPKGQIKIKIKI
jgi:hypothetical protein